MSSNPFLDPTKTAPSRSDEPEKDVEMSFDGDDDGDEASKAFAAISAQLQDWISPSVGSLSANKIDDDADDNEDEDGYAYGMDPVDWFQQELQGQPPSPRRMSFSSPRRIERAATPTISNSSSKKPKKKLRQQTPQQIGNDSNADVDTVMKPVQSPWVNRTALVVGDGAPMVSASQTAVPLVSSREYKGYHDALRNYLQARRSLSDRLDLEDQHNALTTGSPSALKTSSSILTRQEARFEADLLQAFHLICLGRRNDSNDVSSNSEKEGSFWGLMATLRNLGLTALLWPDDPVSLAQHEKATSFYRNQIAAKGEMSPLQVVEALKGTSSDCPLLLQRRYQLVLWLQRCLHHKYHVVLPRPQLAPPRHNANNGASHPDALGMEPPQHKALMQICLSHVLSGQLEDAKALVRQHGQHWRAAAWSGGRPAGIEKVPNHRTKNMDSKSVGNIHRFVWKRQTWKIGKSLLQKGNVPEEAAISSLLANDVHSCLSNPALQTWEQGLYSILFCMWGRLEDETLHQHTTNRAKMRPPYPSNDKKEKEQLLATSGLVGMNEGNAVQMLRGSSFVGAQSNNLYEKAMGAFVSGKSAIVDFCSNAPFNGSNCANNDIDSLRFLTHLFLYLDSLSACTTPVDITGVAIMKDRLLSMYVEHLASRPELWNLWTLYASLLPEDILSDYYPKILVDIHGDHERNGILEQLRELCGTGVDWMLVRQVVRLVLRASPAPESAGEWLRSRDYAHKCKSLQWLLQYEEHLGEALICANILLRTFFLEGEPDETNNEERSSGGGGDDYDNYDNPMYLANVFIQDHLPDDLLERAGTEIPEFEGLDSAGYRSKIDNARAEHVAFVSYLEAHQAFAMWKDTIQQTSVTGTVTRLLMMDTSNLNSSEASIARSMYVRDVVRHKMKASEMVIETADNARKALFQVLTHPGGWLSTEDEELIDDEDKIRRQEISQIRSRCLPLAVSMYHEVCDDTARWMSRSLDHGVEALELPSRMDVFKAVAGNDEDPNTSCLAPLYWSQHALDLVDLVANDAFCIHKAYGQLELAQYMDKVAETAVSKLLQTI